MPGIKGFKCMRIISGLQEAKTSRTCSDVPIGKNNKFHVRGGGGVRVR